MSENKFQVKGKTKLVKGSILTPEGGGLRLVLNITNMAGKAEGPLYPIFEKKWKKVKEEVKGWYSTKTGAYKLGAINSTAVQSDVWVVHCLAQDDQLHVDAKGLEDCLKKVCATALYEKASLHVSSLLTSQVPGLEDLLTKCLVEKGVSVFFYEEPVAVLTK